MTGCKLRLIIRQLFRLGVFSLFFLLIIRGGIDEPIVLRGQFGVEEHGLLPQHGCLLGSVSHLPLRDCEINKATIN